MAKFVVLKNGLSHRVFDFDGNIARVGSGSTVDLQLETPGIEGDLFFIEKQSSGYEIERRARDLIFTVNGAPVGDRVLLQEGDKVGFLDYIMVTTYQSQEQPTPPTAEAKPRPVPDPPKPAAKGAERATMIIDPQALAEQAMRERGIQPADSRDQSNMVQPAAKASPKPEPPKTPKKQKVAPVYTLCVLTGQHKGRAFEIDTAEYVIGRERGLCDLVIDHDEHGQPEMSISREHLAITSTEEGLYLTDKRSQLRTYINRKIIEPGQREFIAPEDIISIPAPSGEVFLRLCFRGQENFAPMSAAGPIDPKWIMILGAVIVVLVVALIFLLR